MDSFATFLSEATHKPGVRGVPPLVKTGEIRKFVKDHYKYTRNNGIRWNREDFRNDYNARFPDYDDAFYDEQADALEKGTARADAVKAFASHHTNAAGRGAVMGAKIGQNVGQVAGFFGGATAGVATSLTIQGGKALVKGIKAVADRVNTNREHAYYRQHRM